jgi:hypothetical protein
MPEKVFPVLVSGKDKLPVERTVEYPREMPHFKMLPKGPVEIRALM